LDVVLTVALTASPLLRTALRGLPDHAAYAWATVGQTVHRL